MNEEWLIDTNDFNRDRIVSVLRSRTHEFDVRGFDLCEGAGPAVSAISSNRIKSNGKTRVWKAMLPGITQSMEKYHLIKHHIENIHHQLLSNVYQLSKLFDNTVAVCLEDASMTTLPAMIQLEIWGINCRSAEQMKRDLCRMSKYVNDKREGSC